MSSARICPADTGVAAALRDLRRALGISQVALASTLCVKQPHIAQFERQDDMHLSTLRRYVEALGGTLELVIRLPDPPLPGGTDKTSHAYNETQGASNHARITP